MRLFGAISCSIPLFAYLIPSVTATLMTLSQIQPISGFSDTCSSAYNTPLTQCTPFELDNGRFCSMNCVILLEEVSALINTACKGTKTYPNTLIGLFLRGTAVQALCKNVLDSGGSTGSSGGNGGGSTGGNTGWNTGGNTGGNTGENTGGGQNGKTTAVVSTSKAPANPSTSSTTAEASTTHQITQTQPAPANTPTSLVTSTVLKTSPAVQPTIDSASTLTQTGLAGLKSSTVPQSASSLSSTSTSSSATATTQQDRNENGNSGGSGGTPFDISASSRKMAATPSMVAFTFGFVALLWIV